MMLDLAIIGAGPAGLSAAMYAIRKGVHFCVFSEDIGGKTNYSLNVEDMEEYKIIKAKEIVGVYRGRLEYLDHLYRHGRIVAVAPEGNGFSLEFVTKSGESEPVSAANVLVATGSRPQFLGVPGEKQYIGRALGYSSISYSHFFPDKTVFVVGNTDRALRAAAELSVQAAEVILAIEPNASYETAFREHVESSENIHVIENATVVEFLGGAFAEEVVISVGANRQVIRADGFFVERDPVPCSESVEKIVECDATKHIVVDARCRTSYPGIFAAGDVTNVGLEQILVSLGEGAKAVLGAYDRIVQARE